MERTTTAAYDDDRLIVEAILKRDRKVTVDYLYGKCYPLFYSIFSRYYTDSTSCVEFINDIYIYLLTPNAETGQCRLEGFGYRCSLTMWLKIVAEKYCFRLFSKKMESVEEIFPAGDRLLTSDVSLDADLHSLNHADVERLLEMMPNERYRQLIKLHYIDEKSHEETAKLLQMTMANYYNKHKLAKEQFCKMLRKEGLL